MSILEKVEESKNIRDATKWIAAGLDELLDEVSELTKLLLPQPVEDKEAKQEEWLEWANKLTDAVEAATASPKTKVKVVDTDEYIEFEVPPVSEAVYFRRSEFAKTLGMEHQYPHADIDQLVDAYAKVGPDYLLDSDLEFVMALPYSTRRAMVQDLVDNGDPQHAHEVGRAILKQPMEVDISATTGLGGDHL